MESEKQIKEFRGNVHADNCGIAYISYKQYSQGIVFPCPSGEAIYPSQLWYFQNFHQFKSNH